MDVNHMDVNQKIKRLEAEVIALKAENIRLARQVGLQRAWAKSAHNAKERLQRALERAG